MKKKKFKINVNINNPGQNRDRSGTEVIISREIQEIIVSLKHRYAVMKKNN